MELNLRNYKNIAEHFKCPIHLGKLRDPRRLACEHTFCAECLNGCIHSSLGTTSDGMFECPICRTKHHIPASDTGDWARGFPIDAFCVIQLHTLSQCEKSTVCEKHIEKFKEYFCFHHRELLCSDCVIEKHTKSPCSCGSVQDAIMEVRLQIKEQIAKLRLQEERARRIMQSQVAASHSDDLLKRISQVEKLLNKFHKTMKSKLKESKQKVLEATKISHSDRDHLSTIQSLISKTKKHVEDVIRPEKSKRTDTANEILSVWTPLEHETQNFDKALDDIETRPYAVNVKADEEFMEFISFDKSPLVVTNDSWDTLPPTPSKERSLSLSRRKSSSIEGGQGADGQSPEAGATIPSPIVVRRTISLTSPMQKPHDNQKLYQEAKRPATQEDTPRNLSSSRLISPTLSQTRPHMSLANVFPKVVTGELKSRDTGKTFHGADAQFSGISEISNFELPCGDILLLGNHLITVTESSIQRFTTDYKYLESVSLRCPWRLCALKDTTNVAVNHNTRFISIVATSPILSILYRIETEKPYSQICHMRTQILEDRFGRIKYHEHIALSHTTDLRADCVDVMTFTYDKNPYSNFSSNQTVKLVPMKTKTLISSDKHSVVRSPNALAATSDGKRLIIGGEAAVVCVKRTGDIIWARPVTRFVASVCCDRGLVFVCIETERKLTILDESGNNLYDNIFPLSCNIVRPNRVSVEQNRLIVREFSEKDWKSTVHVFVLRIL